jgi:DNA-binding MarR family transcriptional regulator
MTESQITGLRELDLMVAQISHLHHFRAHQLLEGLGLYRGQPAVLRILWEKEGQTQTELGDHLKVKPATITKMLQRMEKTGFIIRRPDPEDQRVSRVYLTESGRAVQERMEAIWEIMAGETFHGFTVEEAALLHRFLLQIRDNLVNATGEKPFG